MSTALFTLLLVFCYLMSAFFSGIETGVISISRLRLIHLARGGNRNAIAMQRFLSDPDRLLGTTLVGNNLVNNIASILLASLAQRQWGESGIAAATTVSIVVLLIFGEFLPKAWFSSRPLSRTLPLAGMLRLTEMALLPFSKTMMFVTGLFVKDAKGANSAGRMVSREHLQWLAGSSEASGQISPLESLMIGRALALQTKTAKDVMTPSQSLSCLNSESTLAMAYAMTASSGYNKFPVMEEKTGQCRGILYIQDVLARIAGNPQDKVVSFMRKPFFISPNMRADHILPYLRRNGQRLGLVRDGSGKITGIVTIDAILNIIAGNLPKDTTGERAADRDSPMVFNAAGKEI